MSNLFKKTVFTLFAFVFYLPAASIAGYAQLKPPQGYSPPLSGSQGTFNYGQAANGTTYANQTVKTNAALNVAGTEVVVPVAMRYASNAAQVAATFSFGNPAIFAGLAVGSVLYDYFKGANLEVDKDKWISVKKTFVCSGPCVEYLHQSDSYGRYGSVREAGEGYARARTNPFLTFTFDSCGPFTPDGYAACTNKFDSNIEHWTMRKFTYPGVEGAEVRPAMPSDFTPLETRPLPEPLIKKLPAPLPVDLPLINPDASNIPRTIWVPTGDPVKNPNPGTNPDGSPKPDTWTQPGTRITPSPTPDNPLRVDLQPDPKTKLDPSPNVDEPDAKTQSPTKEKIEIETCGLPGKPKCLIDETGTPADKQSTFEGPKSAIAETEVARKAAIDSAQQIQGPQWSFSFQLPVGCTPLVTGLRGVVLDVCQWRGPMHDLMSMVWAAATAFCLIGMVGRTIREA